MDLQNAPITTLTAIVSMKFRIIKKVVVFIILTRSKHLTAPATQVGLQFGDSTKS